MAMKYLNSFNKQLRFFRDTHRLSSSDIAELCNVDVSVVKSWEADAEQSRTYPSLENLLDLCFKSGSSLEYFIDIPKDENFKQLELPGLQFAIDESDLAETLNKLDKELEKIIPVEQEAELLKRFRKSNEQNRELIMQLINK